MTLSVYTQRALRALLFIGMIILMCLMFDNCNSKSIMMNVNAISPLKIPNIPPSNKNPVVKCVHDLQDLCMDLKVPIDPWECMMNKSDDIDDEDCQAWVEGMKACNKDAVKVKECVTKADNYIHSLRRCIRQLDNTKYLSPECRSSTFYKDLKAAQYNTLEHDLEVEEAFFFV